MTLSLPKYIRSHKAFQRFSGGETSGPPLYAVTWREMTLVPGRHDTPLPHCVHCFVLAKDIERQDPIRMTHVPPPPGPRREHTMKSRTDIEI